MELQQLSVFVLLIHVSLALLDRLIVQKGQTIILSCPITDAHKINVEWKNPEGNIMFFNHDKALKDKRYRINKLSVSEFTISISSVTFKDGGNYTCSQYGHHTIEKKIEVTVLARPKMEVAEDEGTFFIKCTAEGNNYPPQIYWKLNNGPEIIAPAQVQLEDKKYISMGILHVQSVKNRDTVKCLVRSPALYSYHLLNFVKIRRNSKQSHRTTMTSSPTAQPQGSTGVLRTSSSSFRNGRTTVYPTTRDVTAPTSFPKNPDTSTSSNLNTSGWESASEATEVISYNSTERNRTRSINDLWTQTGSEGGSSLLVFLVTCLIFALFVVVIFFAIKLRRALIIWKRENEDSDPSEESSKSKSSQEEKNSQGQRRRGHLNTAFTQYVVEEPTVITSVINTGSMTAAESVNKEQTSQPQAPSQISFKCDVKETEL